MAKKILLILFLMFLIFNENLFSYSARAEVHKYGYFSLGDTISTLYYNPAGLFNLSSKYDEFVLSSYNEFVYNSFLIGKYITRFPFLSHYYWTSMNLGFGMVKNDTGKFYIIGLGGTLIDFFKYGINLKHITVVNKKFLDMDYGLMLKFKFYPSERRSKTEIVFSFSSKNLKNKAEMPKFYVPSLALRPFDELKLSSGLYLNNNFEYDDYSVAMDLNLLNHFYILIGLQKDFVPFGWTLDLTKSYSLEIFSLTFEYDRNESKIDKILLSYRHRFKAFKLTSQKKTSNDEKTTYSISAVRQEQRELLDKAKFYFAEEKLKQAERKFREVISLDENTPEAKEANEWLKKIERLKRKLKIK